MKILIIFVIVVAVVMIYFMNTNKKEHLELNERRRKNDVIDQFDSTDLQKLQKIPSNRIFTEAQFHSDYMDIITAFNNLSPNQRQVFNIDNQESDVTDIDSSEVKNLVSNFITNVNRYVKTSVPTTRTPSCGWDESVPDPNIKSGWDKVQESLGLPGSIYDKFAGQSQLNLVNIQNVTKYETDKEIKYKCIIVVQKSNVSDQLIVNVSFVMTKGLSNQKIHVVIESITIVGFLSVNGMGNERTEADDMYNFQNLEKDNMTPSNTILKELMKKYELRGKLMQEKINDMDPVAQATYEELPHLNDYESHKVTRFITDDMLHPYKF